MGLNTNKISRVRKREGEVQNIVLYTPDEDKLNAKFRMIKRNPIYL